MMIDDHLHLYI